MASRPLAPRVFHLVIAVAERIDGRADDVHDVVVGRGLRVEHPLAERLVHDDLRCGKRDASLLLRQQGDAGPSTETPLRDIGVPCCRITGRKSAVEQSHQRVERNIKCRVRRPVVGNFQHEPFEKRVVEGGQRDVVVPPEADRVGIGKRRVGNPVDYEAVGTRTQPPIEFFVDHPLPMLLFIQFFVDDPLRQPPDRLRQRGVVVGAVGRSAFVEGLRHDAVAVDQPQHVLNFAALIESGTAACADVLDGFFEVGMADDPHLREIERAPSGADRFALDERHPAEGPAGSRLRLIPDRRRGGRCDVCDRVAGGRAGCGGGR